MATKWVKMAAPAWRASTASATRSRQSNVVDDRLPRSAQVGGRTPVAEPRAALGGQSGFSGSGFPTRGAPRSAASTPSALANGAAVSRQRQRRGEHDQVGRSTSGRGQQRVAAAFACSWPCHIETRVRVRSRDRPRWRRACRDGSCRRGAWGGLVGGEDVQGVPSSERSVTTVPVLPTPSRLSRSHQVCLIGGRVGDEAAALLRRDRSRCPCDSPRGNGRRCRSR